jgi:hypothetical protein
MIPRVKEALTSDHQVLSVVLTPVLAILPPVIVPLRELADS